MKKKQKNKWTCVIPNHENQYQVSNCLKHRQLYLKGISVTCLVSPPAQCELCRREGRTTSSPQLMTREWGWWTISSAFYIAKDVPTKNGNVLLHAYRAQWDSQILSVNEHKLKILTERHIYMEDLGWNEQSKTLFIYKFEWTREWINGWTKDSFYKSPWLHLFKVNVWGLKVTMMTAQTNRWNTCKKWVEFRRNSLGEVS